MVFKCKICGGSLDVKQGEKITVCEYCGVRQSISSFIEPKIEEIYNRANNYLMHNEFDKAENLYNQILFEDNSNADAYWNVLMCRYGVTYVKDPSSGKYIPTCNRTLYTPIFNDENYKKALQFADEAEKELYVSDARVIDDIQKGILAVSKKEKPFDIFISYKETDINGTRTQDSVAAQDLYERLTAEGYKVFFSRITLEDKIGTEYEPYIYAALASSKVMITICSSRENIEAVWVKNEWYRFLSFAWKDNDKTLIPLYYNMDKKDLPEEFAHLSCYDMQANGFEQELIRGIKKLIPLPIMEKERREKRKKVLKKAGIGVVVLFVIAAICSIPWFMKLPDYNNAMQLYYDKNYPEATWAFDELGEYRNSKDMKDKCERSWRNSQANIKTNTLGNGSTAYYVTANGTIDTFDYAPGTLNKELDINEHGKILSICVDETFAALYEDGYVRIFSDDFSDADVEELKGIIKLAFNYGSEFIALKNNGEMLVPSLSTEDESWLKSVSQWKDIIEIDCHRSSGAASGLVHESIVIGITSNHDLKIATFNFMNFGNESSYDTSIHNRFKNIKKVDANINGEYLNVVALTNDGKLLTEIQGDFNSYDLSDAIDVELVECSDADGIYYKVYVLYSNGNVYEYGKNNFILTDVVYMDNGVLVTRSGSIYTLTGSGIEQTEGKTRVLNEWLERMN